MSFCYSLEVSWQNGKIRIKKSCESNLVVVLVPFDPIDASDNSFECINIHCGPAVEGEIRLNDEQLTVYKRYKSFILYTAAIKEENGITKWSNTITQQGRFELTFSADYTTAEALGYGQVVNSLFCLFKPQFKQHKFSTPLPDLKPK